MKLLRLPPSVAHSETWKVRALREGLEKRGKLLIGPPTDVGLDSPVWKITGQEELELPANTTHLIFTSHVFGRTKPRPAIYAAQLQEKPIEKPRKSPTKLRSKTAPRKRPSKASVRKRKWENSSRPELFWSSFLTFLYLVSFYPSFKSLIVIDFPSFLC